MMVFTAEKAEKILGQCVKAGFFTEPQAQAVREELAQGRTLPDVLVRRKLISRETFVTAASVILGIPPAEIEGKGHLTPEGRQG